MAKSTVEDSMACNEIICRREKRGEFLLLRIMSCSCQANIPTINNNKNQINYKIHIFKNITELLKQGGLNKVGNAY